MFSLVGDTILDPFLGSGTTSLAAKNLSRNSIGDEISPTFIPIIKSKLQISQHDIFGDATCDFVIRQQAHENLQKDIENGDNGEKTELYSVRQVLSPELLKLSNGLTIRLIGVADEPARRELALQFLISKTKGQRVFLKYDKDKHDENGNLLSYVYLKDETFINAHLIKSGFVSVDLTRQYKYRSKFQNLLSQLNFKRNVGAVSEAIRKCAPKTADEWREYYFAQVRSKLYVSISH